MDKKLYVAIVLGGFFCLGLGGVHSYALSVDELAGVEFTVFMSCDNEVGEYCESNDVGVEGFIFEDESTFWVETFKDDSHFDLDFASGTYEENGIMLAADFEAIDELVKKYVFDIVSLNFFNALLLGQSEIAYYRYRIPEFDYIKEDEAKCYFIGFPK
jgi:hypothetical protein